MQLWEVAIISCKIFNNLVEFVALKLLFAVRIQRGELSAGKQIVLIERGSVRTNIVVTNM